MDAAQNLGFDLDLLQHITSRRSLPFDTPEDMECSSNTKTDFVDQTTAYNGDCVNKRVEPSTLKQDSTEYCSELTAIMTSFLVENNTMERKTETSYFKCYTSYSRSQHKGQDFSVPLPCVSTIVEWSSQFKDKKLELQALLYKLNSRIKLRSTRGKQKQKKRKTMEGFHIKNYAIQDQREMKSKRKSTS